MFPGEDATTDAYQDEILLGRQSMGTVGRYLNIDPRSYHGATGTKHQHYQKDGRSQTNITLAIWSATAVLATPATFRYELQLCQCAGQEINATDNNLNDYENLFFQNTTAALY